MKRLIPILSILTFFSLSFFAQSYDIIEGDTINYTDVNNLKQGLWIDYDKKIEGSYIDNKQEGIWKAYYKNGNIKSEITYINGEKKGYAKIYYENGKIAEEGTWLVDKWVGSYKSYYSNGKLSYLWNFNEHGSRCGYQKYFYENGKIKIEGEWEDGQETGVIKEYFSSGSLRAEKYFESGKCKPDAIIIYSEKKNTELIADNKTDDTLKQVKTDTIDVFSGNGKHIIYNKYKLPEKNGDFKNGILTDGEHYIYDQNNVLIKTIVYKNGEKIKTINN